MSQNHLLTLLENSTRAGIYHLPPGRHALVKATADGAGFACFEVHLGDCDGIEGVLSQIGLELDFPEWYGQNLDALKDCLTDFSWCEAAGYVLFVSGADALQAVDPEGFQILNQIFAESIAEWRSQNFAMWVLYDLRVDGLATLPTLP